MFVQSPYVPCVLCAVEGKRSSKCTLRGWICNLIRLHLQGTGLFRFTCVPVFRPLILASKVQNNPNAATAAQFEKSEENNSKTDHLNVAAVTNRLVEMMK